MTRTGRRQAGVALLACLAGGALTLFAAGRPWADGEAVQGTLRAPLEVSGGDLAPAVPTLAFAALAGALAVLATRGSVRRLVGFAVLCCGLGVVAAAASAVEPDGGELATRAGEALGTASAVAAADATGWAWVALAGGALIAIAGARTAAAGARWPAMSARYDAPRTTPARDEPPAGALEQWRALDRGEDPTA